MDSVLRHELPFLLRARTVAFLRKTCFGRCNRYPECMPLLTSGSYTVALPDGRTQNVDYTADHYNGFLADVSYKGYASYPPPAPYHPAPYKPAPAPYKPSPPVYHPPAPVYHPAPYKPRPIYH
ncbi:Structural constituent of cuticle [Halocaridina rubra]|uniref:Structural constituent of cuticle n=1 Tax=Halocaridina rubra TaxID=373956 RepID=A0AAN9A2W5_HALRR